MTDKLYRERVRVTTKHRDNFLSYMNNGIGDNKRMIWLRLLGLIETREMAL